MHRWVWAKFRDTARPHQGASLAACMRRLHPDAEFDWKKLHASSRRNGRSAGVIAPGGAPRAHEQFYGMFDPNAGRDGVDFVAVVEQVIALLHQRGRVAYPLMDSSPL